MKRRLGQNLPMQSRVGRRKVRYRPRLEGLETRELLALSPVGTEFRVNTTTTNAQQSPAIASDNAGDFVVVWQSGDFSNGYDIRAQRYNASGVAQGGELVVNSSTTNSDQFRFNPSVAMDADGDFVVSWEYYDLSGTNTTGYDIFARRFNAAGVGQGNEFVVNSTSTGDQFDSAVAMDGAGDFSVVWTDFSSARVMIRAYNSAGTAAGAAANVDTTVSTTQSLPSVSIKPDGSAVLVAWAAQTASGDTDTGVYHRAFNISGSPTNTATRVNTTTTGTQTGPSIAVDSSGNYVVAWSGNGTGDSQGIFFQRFDSGGTKSGSETRAHTGTTGGQIAPAVGISNAASSVGSFTIAWTDDTSEASNNLGVYAQNFTAAGVTSGNLIHVNTTTTGNQSNAVITVAGTGATTIAWQSNQTGNTDVWAQRYSVVLNPIANNQSVGVAQDTAKAITLTGTDPNSPPLSLTYTVSANPAHGTLSGTAPNLTYTPASGYFGSDSFTFTVTNSAGLTSTAATVSINVVGKPIANNQNVTANTGVAKSISLGASDPNTPPKTLTYSIVGGPSHGTLTGFNAATGAVTYTSDAYVGADSFTFRVNNGVMDSDLATVFITVNSSVANVTQTNVSWGTRTSGNLVTQGDGLRLLPSGRSTSIPWLNVDRIGITLSGSVALVASDVTVTSTSGTAYGPVTLSGGGTSYVITLAQPISVGDRVTFTINNPGLSTFTRRLDVLPGDANDDGFVNSTDASIALAASRGISVVIPLIFLDVDGDGFVTVTDYNLIRARSGRSLPPLP
ncbi:MAG: Ig-like domain-containing protein [Isosphaeraceae bacterium]